MYSMAGSSSLGLLINIKKILHSQSLLPQKLRDMCFFCLLGVSSRQAEGNEMPTLEGLKQHPILTYQRISLRTLKDGYFFPCPGTSIAEA